MSTDRPTPGVTARPARFWAAAGVFVVLGLVLGLALAGTLRIQPDSPICAARPAHPGRNSHVEPAVPWGVHPVAVIPLSASQRQNR